MTLFQVEELTSYWTRHPPLHLLVAAYLGIDKHKQQLSAPIFADHGQRSGSEPGSVLTQLGPGFNGGDVHAGLPPVVLDFGELRQQRHSRC